MYFVLFFMSVQSAFFGPPKYGILPEMIRQRDLPRANGIFLMTTFLAIIFGLSAAGALKETFQPNIWFPASVCVLVAVIGTLTSLVVRPTPIAQPNLEFEITALAIPKDMRRVLVRDRQLLGVLLATSMFWMIGSIVYPPAVNSLGKKQMGLNDQQTSIMAACTGMGIAIGCVIAGKLSQNQVRFGLVRMGAFGLVGSMLLLACPGPALGGTLLGRGGSILGLISLGIFAGFFSVPLQVFLQARAPENLKGRIIAAMNLTNWIGIMASSIVYLVVNQIVVLLNLPVATSFALCALMLLPVAIFYRPADTELR
jgi:acyl-[acyl-carrier-protein]-phospholipid O-acyltransferase/long-chain-fatty-acid--[acyl-carrier-protein] ligase